MQEHHTKGVNALAPNNQRGIFPVAKAHFFIDIFISQINAADYANLSVNHYNFAVVAVIQSHIQMGLDRVENGTFDTKAA